MSIQDIEAIDVHSHYNHGSRYDTVVSDIYRADIGYLKKMYDSANIKLSFCSTFASVLSPDDVFSENQFNYSLSQRTSWLYQWVVVEPRKKETFDQAEYMLRSPKCVGIKIHPLNHNYSIYDYGDMIFSFAEKHNTVVQMHPEDPAGIPSLVNRYPGMSLIIAHLGSVDHVEAIKKSKYGNIYVDTSGNASIRNRIIEYAVEQVGADNILFGTDTYSAASQRGRIEYAQISFDDKQKILRTNALKLFEKKLLL